MVIVACCQDPGGTNGMVPVVKELRSRSWPVVLIGEGWAAGENGLPNMDISFTTASNHQEILEKHPKIEAVVVTSCGNGPTIGVQLVEHFRRSSVLTYVLSDQWGAPFASPCHEKRFRPKYICVNDEIERAMVLCGWPNFNQDNVYVVGLPAMDYLASMNMQEAARQTRQVLQIADNEFVVVFTPPVEHVGDLCEVMVRALNALPYSVTFIPRLHPRTHKDGEPVQVLKYHEELVNFQNGRLICNSCQSIKNTTLVLPIADIVIGPFSTVQVTAAALGRNVISYLPPLILNWYLHDLLKNTVDDFPLVKLGCSAKATSQDELIYLLETVQQGGEDPLGIREAQKRVFSLDGKNAARVADFILSTIKVKI